MSIFVHSDDFKSGGSSSDGVWTFSRNLKGNWSVIGQHMDTQTFPWMEDGNNVMVMEIHDPEDLLESVIFEITFEFVGTLSDINAIAASMTSTIQSAINSVAVDDHAYAARLVDYEINGNEISFIFSDDPVDIRWQGFDDGFGTVFASTCNVPLGRSPSTPNELAVYNLIISTGNMNTDPKYLEVYISESNTQIATSHGTRPTLLFSTRDGEFTGQSFSISSDTQQLTIQIKRMSDSIVVPLSGQWFLIFQSAS